MPRRARIQIGFAKRETWGSVCEKVCHHFGVKEVELAGPSRADVVARAREVCVYVGKTRLRMSGEDLARRFNQTESGISRAYYRASGWVKEEKWLWGDV